MRKLFNKNFSDENISKALKKLGNTGIPVRGNFIIAPPTEKKVDFYKTVKTMVEVKKTNPANTLAMYQYISIPGTELITFENKSKDTTLSTSTLSSKNMDAWSNYYHLLSKKVSSTSPWLAKRDTLGRQPILFYIRFAFLNLHSSNKFVSFPLKMLQIVAKIRIDYRIYSLPLEWYVYKYLRETALFKLWKGNQ
jgi:radical SAM superfamily enzyme YgiQ (UPF0313 family)